MRPPRILPRGKSRDRAIFAILCKPPGSRVSRCVARQSRAEPTCRITRRILLLTPLAAAADRRRRGAAAPAPSVADRAVLRRAPRRHEGGGSGCRSTDRYNRLAPAITRTFDLALMARIAIGPEWAQIRRRAAAAARRRLLPLHDLGLCQPIRRFRRRAHSRSTPDACADANGVIVRPGSIKSERRDGRAQLPDAPSAAAHGRSSTSISAARSASWRRGARNSPRCCAAAPTGWSS